MALHLIFFCFKNVYIISCICSDEMWRCYFKELRLLCLLYEPRHDKTNDQHGSRPACTSAQSDQDPCCSLTNTITSRETDSEQHVSWSDCADAQASLDLCWSQTHYVCFVVTRLIYNAYYMFMFQVLNYVTILPT
jgi:hypothetical protein